MEVQSSLLSVVLLVTSIWSSSCTLLSDEESRVCISQGGRFPRFSLEGQPPRKSTKGPDDLTLCRVYRKKTCCTAAQTHPALVAIRKLAINGEGSEECLMFWEAMECALCDPQVGVRQGPPALCNSFCESCLDACSNAFFSFDSMTQVLQPCGPKDIICARASEWATNGSQFCELAGFAVPSSKDIVKPVCFDGKPSLNTDIAASRKSGKKGTNTKQQSTRDMVQNLIMRMDRGDVIAWAVGGLVLTAGVMLMRRQSLSSQRKKAAMLRLVQEARSKQQEAMHVTDKKSRKRA